MARSTKDGSRGLFGRMASGASDRVLEIVDPNMVLDHIDVDALLERVDINALLERVDVNKLLEKVDLNTLMNRLDIDALMERVDVQDIVDRAGIPDIVMESTSHLTGSALDFFRRPLVGLDEIIFRGANRVIGRRAAEYPEGPGDLVTWVADHGEDRAAVKTGRYGGPLTRLLAFIIDMAVISFAFTLLVAGIVFVVGLVSPEASAPEESGLIYGVSLLVFGFLYLWISYAVFGKTIGKSIVGLRVVSSDGHITMSGRQPFVRVITYPLSFIVFGIGLLGVVFNPRRAAWHDKFAKTAVVYDWGSRAATMPTPLADYLDRKGASV